MDSKFIPKGQDIKCSKNLNSQCETKNHNAKTCPERSRMGQDSAGGMGNISSRDLFIHISKIMQTRIIRQLPKVFDKLTYFYAKQSQFPKRPNECKLLFAKGI